jgi:hypothetical protein
MAGTAYARRYRMTEPHKVHCYARVDRPYESVRDVLHKLLTAGETASPFCVHSIFDEHGTAGLPALTRATLGVTDEAPHDSHRLASAEIYASALSARETQIEIEGHCVDRTRGGVDATVRGDAETHVLTLLESVVERIRSEVGRSH